MKHWINIIGLLVFSLFASDLESKASGDLFSLRSMQSGEDDVHVFNQEYEGEEFFLSKYALLQLSGIESVSLEDDPRHDSKYGLLLKLKGNDFHQKLGKLSEAIDEDKIKIAVVFKGDIISSVYFTRIGAQNFSGDTIRFPLVRLADAKNIMTALDQSLSEDIMINDVKWQKKPGGDSFDTNDCSISTERILELLEGYFGSLENKEWDTYSGLVLMEEIDNKRYAFEHDVINYSLGRLIQEMLGGDVLRKIDIDASQGPILMDILVPERSSDEKIDFTVYRDSLGAGTIVDVRGVSGSFQLTCIDDTAFIDYRDPDVEESVYVENLWIPATNRYRKLYQRLKEDPVQNISELQQLIEESIWH